MDKEKNIKKFEFLMEGVTREGKDALMDYIRKSDFYTAPASTKFHLSTEGGLLQHSLNVYDCLIRKEDNETWGNILRAIGRESQIIISLLHDICKTNFYTVEYRNQKTYDPEKVRAAERWQVKKDNGGSFIWEQAPYYSVNDKVPYGHGEKSVMMIEQFMRLTGPERYAIRWHMGYTETKEYYLQLNQAMALQPLILALHEADQEASLLLEDTGDNKRAPWEQPEPETPTPGKESSEPDGCDFEDAEPVGQ